MKTILAVTLMIAGQQPAQDYTIGFETAAECYRARNAVRQAYSTAYGIWPGYGRSVSAPLPDNFVYLLRAECIPSDEGPLYSKPTHYRASLRGGYRKRSVAS